MSERRRLFNRLRELRGDARRMKNAAFFLFLLDVVGVVALIILSDLSGATY